ncbi:AAA family ATPase [Haloferula sp.]|uniref:AAA family ATPase n=1 Tax=Haloferula sp. TaxID=2497595 RepID=UPI003C708489
MTSLPKFHLKFLTVDGGGKRPAALQFNVGLNAIIGASDTGKSFTFQVIEYLLGADRIPRDNPHGRGCNQGSLELATSDESSFVIERTFGDNSVRWRCGSLGDASNPTDGQIIAAGHKKGDHTTLSTELLKLFGFEGHQILRSEKSGEKNEVSFRNVAHLTMVDEIRIIRDGSPALSGQRLFVTPEQRLWNLFLTGSDDAGLTSKPPSKKERNLLLDAKIDWITKYISEQEKFFARFKASEEEISQRSSQVDDEIFRTTETMSSKRDLIVELETRREELWNELVVVKDRLIVVQEHLDRFDLLQRYYETDKMRLSAAIEAGASFENLPGGQCATCGAAPEYSSSDTLIENFSAAAKIELNKVNALAQDLAKTIASLSTEKGQLLTVESRLSDQRSETQDQIDRELRPATSIAAAALRELVQKKSELERAQATVDELKRLHQDLDVLEAEKRVKVPQVAKLEKTSTRTASEFCRVVENTLRAWRYPLNGHVAFDPKKFDIVIGDQDRGSMGKGHRALTHAAVTISLMRFCREQNLPHPGFVMLDSPLNPYRGKSLRTGADAPVSAEVKDAFYEDLAKDSSGDQFIIFENDPPPVGLVDVINYIEFTGDANLGRAGFFPMA